MKIEDLEQLEKLLKLCQKMSVHTVEVDGIKVAMVVRAPEVKMVTEDDSDVHIDPATGLPFTEEEFRFFQELQTRSN